jgi:structure-specific recognition protein 1
MEEDKKEEKEEGEEDDEEEEDEEDDDDEEEITPAKVLNDKIVKAAGIGEFAGEVIATLPELPMIIPRGKYTLDLFATFAKMHGRTHDYKILYKDINKGFLLPKPDGVHMAYVLHLKTPLRQGQTLHHFIAMQFDRDQQYKIKVNLLPEQIKESYGDKLQPEMEGPLYDVLSKLFKELMKINILIPGDFRSHKGDEAIKCSYKASDGYVYPLKNSLIFIHKPVIYIKLTEIKYVEFSRLGQIGGSNVLSRSFDMVIVKLKDEPNLTFAGIDKEEQKNLTNYFRTKNVKMRTVDVETH